MTDPFSPLVWSLGSTFLSLIRQTPCTSLPSIPYTKSTHSDTQLDDSARGGHLAAQTTNIHQRPSLSDRLTSPSSTSGNQIHLKHSQPSYQPSSANENLEPLVQSFPSNYNLYEAPYHPLSNLANRFDPAPKKFITSSNLTESNSRAWRSWGPKTFRPDYPQQPHQLNPPGSNDHSHLSHQPGYPPASSPLRTNTDFTNTAASRLMDCREEAYESKFQGDQHKKKRKYKLNPIDWGWNHWTSKEVPPMAKIRSPQSSESINNCSPPSLGAGVSAIEWKKKVIEVGLDKVQNSNPSHSASDVHSGHQHKRHKTSSILEHRDLPTGRHTTRSISPAVASSQAGSSSGRLPIVSRKNYYKLAPLHPALKDSIRRAVYSWINQLLVECFWKIGIWFEDSKRWKADQWGSIRLDQLERMVDLHYPKGLSSLLKTCKTDRFIDLTIKPIHSGIVTLHKDPQTNAHYLKMTKDFTPIGLLYRPIIKTLRKLLTSTGTNRTKIEKFVRHHLLKSSEEEDLIYLFQNDDDPYGCIRRAARDGIIEIYNDHHLLTSPSANQAGFLDHPPPRHGSHKRKRVAFDEQYIGLKAHWLTNKEPSDIPSLYSPTISQGGSSGMPQTEEETSRREGANNQESNQREPEVNASILVRKEESATCSKTSSTNTDGSDHVEMPSSMHLTRKAFPQSVLPPNHPTKSARLNQHIVFGKSQINDDHLIGSHLSSSPHDDAIIDAIILQYKKDIFSYY